MLTSLDEICARNISNKKTLAVVCASNRTALEAVSAAKNDGAVMPVLYGEAEKITAALREIGEDPADYCIEASRSQQEAAERAVASVRRGEAQILLKGDIHTSLLMRAVLDKSNGIREAACMMNMGLIEVPGYHKLLTISDGAILLRPTMQQKADMIRCISERLHVMGSEKVKVAILAASDEVSDKQPETLDAVELKAMYEAHMFADYVVVDGPLAFDLCVDARSAKAKGYHSEVAGDADLIICHDIVVANAVVKAMRIFAGAKSASMVLGARAPIILTSRGASSAEKYMAIMVAAAAV